MEKLGTMRWIAVGLHGIVLAFSLVVTSFSFSERNILEIFMLSENDAVLGYALCLSALLIGGNGVGIILLLTPLFKSFSGASVLVVYELSFFVASLLFLSPDYSLIIGVIVCLLLYVANTRRKVSHYQSKV